MKGPLIVEFREQSGTPFVPLLACYPKRNGILPQDLAEHFLVNVRRLAAIDQSFHLCYAGCATSEEARTQQGKGRCATSDILIGTKVSKE